MGKQMGDWYNQYFCNFNKYSIANKLWVYYYAKVEKYDRNLNQVLPSIYEEGVVVPYGDSRKWSEQNARKVHKFIYDVANHYEVNNEQMEYEKKCICRMKQPNIEREFEAIEDQNGFKFIDDYIECANNNNRYN